MEYFKQPLTIAEQIGMLQERGLLFQDAKRAQYHLCKISYFRLAAYLRPFEQDKTLHIFKSNKFFESVIQLYNFDKELRTLLFTAIHSVEVAFRAALINHVGLKYGSFWFMNPELFNTTFYIRNIENIRKEVERSTEDYIEEYYAKYTSPDLPPVWKTLEVVSFGSLYKTFRAFNDNALKKKIAREFALPQHVYLENWISAIVTLRNSIAHHARIWNRNFTFAVSLPEQLSAPWIDTKGLNSTKLFAILSCVHYLLQAIEPENHFKEDLLALFAAYPNVDLRAMGFPENWREFPLWK